MSLGQTLLNQSLACLEYKYHLCHNISSFPSVLMIVHSRITDSKLKVSIQLSLPSIGIVSAMYPIVDNHWFVS